MSRSNPMATGNLHRSSLPDPAVDRDPDGEREVDTRFHDSEVPDRTNPPEADGDVGGDAGAEPRPSDAQSHEDSSRRRLRLRLSVSAQETMKSFAAARGISRTALLDALLHGLEAADQSWLDGVIDQARRLDVHHRSEDG